MDEVVGLTHKVDFDIKLTFFIYTVFSFLNEGPIKVAPLDFK